jgi:TPR repeat protein
LETGQGVSIDLTEAVKYYKLAADQGYAAAQNNYGYCLQQGKGISINLTEAVHYFKLAADRGDIVAQYNLGMTLRDHSTTPMDLTRAADFLEQAADQGYPNAQFAFAVLLWDGRGIAQNSIRAVRYFRLAADHGHAEAQYRYGLWLLSRESGHRDVSGGIQYLNTSAENGNPDGQFVIGCMAEHGIGLFHSVDLETAVSLYERCCDRSPAGAACLGRCFQTGRGAPVDFTTAAECFKKASDSDDVDGINCFGCCLERGEGVDADIERAAAQYRKAASFGHPDALYNFGRCLEYGRGVPRDLDRAAKYYGLSAAKGNAAAQNSFGICLERGLGAHKNQCLAAQFYLRAAAQGHADGANNFGFCLEHGRGVQQDFAMAAEYYGFAANRGHPDGAANRARCLRLLGRWEPPDRSSDSVSHSAPDRLCEIFRDLCDGPGPTDDDGRSFAMALRRLKTFTPSISVLQEVKSIGDENASGDSSIVKLTIDSELAPIAVKTAKNAACVALIFREAAILERLKHPLVVRLLPRIPKAAGRGASIVTEYAGHGALASHLPPDCGDQRCLRGPNRIAKVIVGIALAMRFVHSRGLTHCDLTPSNILLDWDWTVRIADFGHSAAPGVPEDPSRANPDPECPYPVVESRYLAPECYDCTLLQASDVFAFGLILFEILAGEAAFDHSLDWYEAGFQVNIKGIRPKIPESIPPGVRALIEDCWAADPDDRPTFKEIVDRLAAMQFRVIADVNAAKVAKFVRRIEDWESSNSE